MNVQQHLSVEWSAEVRSGSDSDTSPEFEVGNSVCFLNLHRKLLDSGRIGYDLFIDAYPAPPNPLRVEAMILGCAGPLLRLTETVRTPGYSRIWHSADREVTEVVPEFRERPVLRFRIVIRRECDCVATGFFRTADKSTQTPTHLDDHFRFETLSRDLDSMFNRRSDTDVELRCGGRIFWAHRSLLGSRSAVFEAMLQSNMLEGQTGQVHVDDMEDSVFELFLRYLYAGKLPQLTVDSAMSLYECGDKYVVEGLKKECASFLTDHLAADIACALLILADRHCDSDLKSAVTAYIVDSEIPLNEEIWLAFREEHSRLAFEVYDYSFKLHATK